MCQKGDQREPEARRKSRHSGLRSVAALVARLKNRQEIKSFLVFPPTSALDKHSTSSIFLMPAPQHFLGQSRSETAFLRACLRSWSFTRYPTDNDMPGNTIEGSDVPESSREVACSLASHLLVGFGTMEAGLAAFRDWALEAGFDLKWRGGSRKLRYYKCWRREGSGRHSSVCPYEIRWKQHNDGLWYVSQRHSIHNHALASTNIQASITSNAAEAGPSATTDSRPFAAGFQQWREPGTGSTPSRASSVEVTAVYRAVDAHQLALQHEQQQNQQTAPQQEQQQMAAQQVQRGTNKRSRQDSFDTAQQVRRVASSQSASVPSFETPQVQQSLVTSNLPPDLRSSPAESTAGSTSNIEQPQASLHSSVVGVAESTTVTSSIAGYADRAHSMLHSMSSTTPLSSAAASVPTKRRPLDLVADQPWLEQVQDVSLLPHHRRVTLYARFGKLRELIEQCGL